VKEGETEGEMEKVGGKGMGMGIKGVKCILVFEVFGEGKMEGENVVTIGVKEEKEEFEQLIASFSEGKGVKEEGVVFEPGFGKEVGGEKVGTALFVGGRGIEEGRREEGRGIVFGEAIEDARVPFDGIVVIRMVGGEMTNHGGVEDFEIGTGGFDAL